MNTRKYGYIRCSLDGSNHLYAAPAELPPLPDLPQASFFCPQSSAERLVVERLNLLECVSNSDLLTRHFLHWMGTVPTSVGKNFSFVKEALADWLTKKSPIPRSKVWQADIFSHPVIPLPVLDEQRHYGCLDEMIDPSSKLARLYDAEERRFPCSDFFARHKNTLTTYGILSKPAWFTPIERAKYLSQRHDDIDTGKIQSLLELPVLPEFANSDAAISEIRSLKWLPGTSAEGQSVLLAPNECRGADQSYLVDMVLGTTTLSVNPKWKNVLGESPIFRDLSFVANFCRLE